MLPFPITFFPPTSLKLFFFPFFLLHCLSNLMSRTYFVFLPLSILVNYINIIIDLYRPMFTFHSSFFQHFSYSSNFLDVDLINFHIFIPSFKYTFLSSIYILYCIFFSSSESLAELNVLVV